MQPNLLQFLVIRWSILIAFGSYLWLHNFMGNKGGVSTLVSNETKNGFADLLFRYERRRSDPRQDWKAFRLNAEAVDHSKRLAARFRNESGHDEPDLTICVLDELGHEIHRELVHPMVPT
jgi:hypothetical protein